MAHFARIKNNIVDFVVVGHSKTQKEQQVMYPIMIVMQEQPKQMLTLVKQFTNV